MKKYIPHICVLASGVLWGLIGLFNRRLTGAGLSVGSIVLIRNLGSMVLLGLMFLIMDPKIFRIRAKHLPIFFGTGVVSVLLFTLCYFSCQKLCSLAVAAVLLYTSPAFVVILSAILWKDRITKKKLLALLLAFLGSTFVTGLWSGDAAVSLWGAVLGVASGLFYGLYSIFGRYALAHYKPFTVTFYTFLFAGLGALAAVRPAELAAAFSQSGVALTALGLIAVCTVAPYLLYTYGLSGMDSGKAAILASVEPVSAAVVGIAAFAEPVRGGVALGLVCILLCVYILR